MNKVNCYDLKINPPCQFCELYGDEEECEVSSWHSVITDAIILNGGSIKQEIDIWLEGVPFDNPPLLPYFSKMIELYYPQYIGYFNAKLLLQ
jgi:hypothetical protein